MCKRCKTCGGTDLGVKITEIKSVAARTVNGEVVETFDQSLEVNQTMETTYCFTCKKDITEADLVDTVKCSSCGAEVESVTEDGLCEICGEAKKRAEEEANRIASLSHDELVALIMSGKLNAVPVAQPVQQKEEVKVEPVAKEKTEGSNGEALSVLNKEDDLVKAEEELNNFNAEIEPVKSEEKTKEKKPRATKKKAEPVEVKEEEVVNATEEISEKVKTAEAPASASGDITAEDEQLYQPPVDVTIENEAIETSVPGIDNVTDIEEEDIMAQLDNINLDNFNMGGSSRNSNDDGGLDDDGNPLF